MRSKRRTYKGKERQRNRIVTTLPPLQAAMPLPCVRPNRRSYALIPEPDERLVASTGSAVLTAKGVPFSYLYFATTTDDFVGYQEANATGAACPAVTSRTFESAKILIPDGEVLKDTGRLVLPSIEQMETLKQQNTVLAKARDALAPEADERPARRLRHPAAAVRDGIARQAGLPDLNEYIKVCINVSRGMFAMAITSQDIVPFNKARADLTRLADEVRAGNEKIITRNGESYVALVDARKLDYYHALERKARAASDFHLGLLQDAIKGVQRIRAGEEGMSVEDAQARMQRRLAEKTGQTP